MLSCKSFQFGFQMGFSHTFSVPSSILLGVYYFSYRNDAINEFVRKLNESKPSLNITRDDLFDSSGRLYSYYAKPDIYDKIAGQKANQDFKTELYQKYVGWV